MTLFTLYFQKQHYDSVVPAKSGINYNGFSALHDIDLFVQRNFLPQNSNARLIYRPRIVIDVISYDQSFFFFFLLLLLPILCRAPLWSIIAHDF